MLKVLALRNRGNMLPLILALLLGLLAAVLTAVYLSSAGNDSGGSTPITAVPVVVATQDIAANTRLTTEMLEVKFLPTDEVNTEAFTARSQVVDRVATQDVAEGEQIVPTQVSSSAGEGVSFVVQPGYRAISVEVREVITVGGNLEPGDHVDVVGIFELADVQSANLLLQILGSRLLHGKERKARVTLSSPPPCSRT
jgi:pilus assembly protein CpaB